LLEVGENPTLCRNGKCLKMHKSDTATLVINSRAGEILN
jgi:hypothetical protein